MTTAAGKQSLMVEAMRALVSGSAAFQGFVGAADAAEALAKVFAIEAPQADGADGVAPPLAVVLNESERQERGGWPRISLGLMLVAPITLNADGTPDWYAFTNYTTPIVSEILTAADPQSGGALHLVGANREELTRATDGNSEKYFLAVYSFDEVEAG